MFFPDEEEDEIYSLLPYNRARFYDACGVRVLKGSKPSPAQRSGAQVARPSSRCQRSSRTPGNGGGPSQSWEGKRNEVREATGRPTVPQPDASGNGVLHQGRGEGGIRVPHRTTIVSQQKVGIPSRKSLRASHSVRLETSSEVSVADAGVVIVVASSHPKMELEPVTQHGMCGPQSVLPPPAAPAYHCTLQRVLCVRGLDKRCDAHGSAAYARNVPGGAVDGKVCFARVARGASAPGLRNGCGTLAQRRREEVGDLALRSMRQPCRASPRPAGRRPLVNCPLPSGIPIWEF
ncbi:hypothetical protein B0H15DRAFT_806602 [Mycena belliarum]|uniref:Uncharacterized protein n=1 Tax=Mycena belliarum TaxID=1033014 RepID=A0AAD6XIV6_9AGAR|nr:hypothetical protein B0H15DRAFT_806602 [Mycena belliae]